MGVARRFLESLEERQEPGRAGEPRELEAVAQVAGVDPGLVQVPFLGHAALEEAPGAPGEARADRLLEAALEPAAVGVRERRGESRERRVARRELPAHDGEQRLEALRRRGRSGVALETRGEPLGRGPPARVAPEPVAQERRGDVLRPPRPEGAPEVPRGGLQIRARALRAARPA